MPPCEITHVEIGSRSLFFPTTQCAPAYIIALSLHTHSPPRSQTGPTMADSGSPQSPKAPTPPKRVASSQPFSPREARCHRRHGSVADSPAAGMSSRDRSKPRKPTTFYSPLTSEDKIPNIFYSIHMCINARHVLPVVPRHRPQHIASSRAAGLVATCTCICRIFASRISASFSRCIK